METEVKSLGEVLPEENVLVSLILEYCRQHYREKIILETLSQEFHLSRGYISQLFNRKVKMSFTDFLHVIRIQAAVALLKNSAVRIEDISKEVGYMSVRSFNRAFREVMQTTPIKYRKLYQMK